MAHESKLVAKKRTLFGSANSRRLRKDGIVPGNVYGHQVDPVPLAVSEDDLSAVIAAGHKVVDLDIEGAVEKAMFREVQWDYLGMRVQHFDLLRVSKDERVTVEIPIELRGTAPGASKGGVLEQTLRALRIECLALQIPDSIVVRIGELELGKSIHVRDLDLPADVKVFDAPDAVVVHVVTAAAELEPGEGIGGPAEPEVIGAKKEAEEDEKK